MFTRQLVRISVARGAAWSAALAPAVKVGLTGQVRNQSARNRNQISIEILHLWGWKSYNRVWDLQNQPPIKDDLSVSTAKAKESHNNRKHLDTKVDVFCCWLFTMGWSLSFPKIAFHLCNISCNLDKVSWRTYLPICCVFNWCSSMKKKKVQCLIELSPMYFPSQAKPDDDDATFLLSCKTFNNLFAVCSACDISFVEKLCHNKKV